MEEFSLICFQIKNLKLLLNYDDIVKCLFFKYRFLSIRVSSEQTLREKNSKKCKNFRSQILKLFREIPHFFAKTNEAKFRENAKICENHLFYSFYNYFLKRTCGILCSYNSILEDFYINYFSSFTLLNFRIIFIAKFSHYFFTRFSHF